MATLIGWKNTDSFLARDLTTAEETLLKSERLISSNTGIIRSLYEHRIAPDDPDFFIFTARMTNTSVYSPVQGNEYNGGCSMDRSRAKAAAIGETIERYCSSLYDPDSLLFASAREMDPMAVQPGSFILFSNEQYAQPDFKFSRFDPSTKIKWTRGYSLTQKKERYVPACMVYIPYRKDEREPLIDYSNTTGLSAANTLEEASLAGIYEVVERDAFMLAWLNRWSREGIDMVHGGAPLLKESLNRYRHTPIRIRANNITTDLDIPTVLITLRSPKGKGPSGVVGAATRLNPVMAAIKALEEAAHTRFWIRSRMEENPKVRPVKDFSYMSSMADHPYLYGFAHMARHLEFLYSDPTSIPVDSLQDQSTGTLSENIDLCVDRLSAKGYEVIMVDVTTSDIEDVGFKVVKILTPGLQPLDVGVRYRHLGGDRRLAGSKALGYPTPISPNPYPHPYP